MSGNGRGRPGFRRPRVEVDNLTSFCLRKMIGLHAVAQYSMVRIMMLKLDFTKVRDESVAWVGELVGFLLTSSLVLSTASFRSLKVPRQSATLHLLPRPPSLSPRLACPPLRTGLAASSPSLVRLSLSHPTPSRPHHQHEHLEHVNKRIHRCRPEAENRASARNSGRVPPPLPMGLVERA